MAVWFRRLADAVWVVQDVASYELINNTSVLQEAPSVALYDNIEIRVADSYDELTDSPSAVTVVAGIAADVTAVAAIGTDVTAVSGVASDIPTVAGDTLAINDITTDPLRTAVLNAGANATSAESSAASAAVSAASIDPTTVLHTVGYGGTDPEGYTSAEADAKFLDGASNLSDVADAPTALTNIGAVAKAGDTMTGQLKGITPVSPEDLTRKDYVDSLGIGINQTWQDVTVSRSAGTTFTNTTGKPIFVSIYEVLGTASHTSYIIVDGIIVNVNSDGGANNKQSTQNAIVPNGSTYSWTSNAVLDKWLELR